MDQNNYNIKIFLLAAGTGIIKNNEDGGLGHDSRYIREFDK